MTTTRTTRTMTTMKLIIKVKLMIEINDRDYETDDECVICMNKVSEPE